MYHFAVVALLGLVALKVTDLLAELVPGLTRVRTLLLFTLAVILAFALDYSLLEGFGIPVRESWMGIGATGLVIGSLSSAWRATFSWLGVSDGDTPERQRPGRPRIAA